MLGPPPLSTLFPYTTLFRSPGILLHRARADHEGPVARLGEEELASSLIQRPESHAVCRSEEHTSELQSLTNLVCRLLLEKKKQPHEPQEPSSAAPLHHVVAH